MASFETDRGTCWVSGDDSLFVCWSQTAGSCESMFVNPVILPVPEEDGGPDGDADAADDASLDGDATDDGG